MYTNKVLTNEVSTIDCVVSWLCRQLTMSTIDYVDNWLCRQLIVNNWVSNICTYLGPKLLIEMSFVRLTWELNLCCLQMPTCVKWVFNNFWAIFKRLTIRLSQSINVRHVIGCTNHDEGLCSELFMRLSYYKMESKIRI